MMKDFLLLFREPDGRAVPHEPDFTEKHQQSWKLWMAPLIANGQLAGGKPLTLNGKIVDTNGDVREGIYKNGTEIVGGFLLIKAESLEAATEIARTCPVLEADGYIEVREIM